MLVPLSAHYPGLKRVVDINLDTLIDTLQHTEEIAIAPEEELIAFEQANPHPDGKRWCVANKPSELLLGDHRIISDLALLSKFDRLIFICPFTTFEQNLRATAVPFRRGALSPRWMITSVEEGSLPFKFCYVPPMGGPSGEIDHAAKRRPIALSDGSA